MSCITKVLQRTSNTVARRLTGTITHVSTQDPVAALTFDDGPHAEFTPRLLDILDRHQAHATFFVVGMSAQRHPDLVRQIAQAGHAIGNHSWDHPSFPLITGQERRAQIRVCAQALAPFGRRLFRPPYGHQSVASYLDARWLGYQVVTWNAHVEDWLDHDADWMASRLESRIQPGTIVLLHDVIYHTTEERYADRTSMHEAVNILLERLGSRIRFITVPELLQHGCVQRVPWYREANPDWLNQLKAEGDDARRYFEYRR